MNELFPIKYADTEEPKVSARELHKALGIEKRFSAWFDTNSQGFIESEDFTSVLVGTEVQNNGGVQIRKLQDYNLSVDMAKQICLMSRTEKGKECRQYLIDLEKAWNTPEQIFARALKMADKTIEKLKHKNFLLEQKIEQDRPKTIFADAVTCSNTSILVGDLAKLLKQNGFHVGQNRLFEILRREGFLIKGGSSKNMPTQKSMEMQLFEIKESTVTNPDGSIRTTKTPKVTGRGQIYFINKFIKENRDGKYS